MSYDPPRILLLSLFPHHVGGLQTHMDLLARALSRAGVPNRLVTGTKLTLEKKLLRLMRRPLAALRWPRLTLIQARMREMERVIQNESPTPDIIHCHEVFSLASVPESFPGTLILTVHGPASKEMEMSHPGAVELVRFTRDVEKRAFARAHAILAVDDGQRDILVNEYGVDATKIRVIINAVDTDLFSPAATVAPSYLLCHRRLVKKNGVHVAIEALRHLEASFRLKIAGDGPEEKNLRQLATSLGVSDRVDFLGSQPPSAMLDLIRNAEIVLLPSVPSHGVIEATSISAIEAMSCGKAVIASRIGGLAQLIRDGVDGKLFEAGRADELARLARELRKQPEERERLEAEARKTAVSRYGAEAWVKKILGVYRE